MNFPSAFMSGGLLAKDAQTIAESLGSRESSSDGAAAGMRLLEFYLSHAARGLSVSRRRNLEKARKLLSAQLIEDGRSKKGER